MVSAELKKKIEGLIKENRVFVFMKGTPEQPMCRFSMAVEQILHGMDVDFAGYNILEDEEMRQGIKEYTNWPTLPQVFIEGKFVGGADIIAELAENGELKKLLPKS